MQSFAKVAVVLAGMLLASGANAQEAVVTISTGDPAAANSNMFKDVLKVCPGLATENTATSGGSDNINQLIMNSVDGGIAASDVAEFLAGTDPNVKKLKSLVTLNPNMLYIIVNRNGYVIDKGANGVMGLGKRDPVIAQISSLSDLNGKPVGVIGSAHITMQRLRDLDSTVSPAVTLIDNSKDAAGKEVKAYTDGIGRLERNEIAALITMGGKVVPWIAQLPQGKFVLVPVRKKEVERFGAPYFTQQITYKNMDSMGVPTLAVRNELFVIDRRGSKGQTLAALRKCYEDHLVDIKDTLGTNPGWQDVDDLSATSWPRFEIAKPVNKK